MQDARELTVGDALAKFRKENGLETAATTSPFWRCRVGPVNLVFPNFRWRREAIVSHDLHHVLTGYSCSMRGEFQLATWEFAAGRFPHPAATLFCLPLVVAGICWSPRAIWRAYLDGRRSRSLYGLRGKDDLLNASFEAVRESFNPRQADAVSASDIVGFGYLLAQASLTVLVPLIVIVGLGIAI